MSNLNLGTGVATQATKGVTQEAPTAADGVVRYSSHPIVKYKIGKYRFENGLLELRDPAEVGAFEKILAALPAAERVRIKKLDLAAAEAQVRAVLAANPVATKATGSEAGDRDPGKKVGEGRLEDLNP